MTFPEIRDRLRELDKEGRRLHEAMKRLQAVCAHPQMPDRSNTFVDYCDICPDCGYIASLFSM